MDIKQTFEAKKDNNLCKTGVCLGSIMFPKLKKCPHAVNMEEMKDFYQQYFASSGASPDEQEARLKEVTSCIEKTGSYSMTAHELEFASKTAWRNASRCIGRIQWSKLKLLDGRDVRSTKEMFDLICEHLKYATNNGNIRSAISVFPSKQSGEICRIWNTQYIMYAGFEVSPGKVIGDPSSVVLTNICLQLGWKAKVSRFQVLPLVLQYGDNNPEFYEIPESLVLEVAITYSKYPKLQELGLKWFAVPAVTFMNMDCGGIQHPATGFNGWYMTTELVRDLCDHNRYNLLKEIAESMDLDTSKPDVFWKDIAAIELNVAIVSSFQALNITITDHHTAAETFMHHMETEQSLRGGCPADWVWITPPISGSLTPVFHQEMLNYKLKPSYEYQQKPWIGFNWKGSLRKGNIREEKLTLRSVARAVMVCYKLMNSARKQRKNCTILYATETGKSERFALKLQRRFDQDFNVEIFCMDKYDVSELKDESLVFIVTSTFGNGEAPDNGMSFEDALLDLCEKKNSSTWTLVPRFAVFGLGSSAYPDYCSFSKRVDKLLADIGVKSLLELHTGDEQKNQEQAFKDWSNKAYQKTCQYFGVKAKRPGSHGDSASDGLTNYKLVPWSKELPATEALQKIHEKDVSLCTTEYVTSLVAASSSDDTVLVSLQHTGLTYEPGDHLAVFPTNSDDMVQKLCGSIILDNGMTVDTPLTVGNANEDDKHHGPDGLLSKLPVTSLSKALKYYLDIECRPQPSDIENFLPLCQCSDEEKKKLLVMSMDPNEYNVWAEKCPTWVDLVMDFPNLRLPASYLLTELPLLQPRYYSVSNSPLVYKDRVHLTVSVLKYTAGSENNMREKLGLCSNWLKNLAAGSKVHAFVRRCASFHLPEPMSENIIMIGAGSGLAPFRSFWQHRLAEDSENTGTGRMYLFQGTKSRWSILHRQELNKVVADGIIEARFTAFSREKHVSKTYVQDKMLEHSDLVYDLLVKKKAHVYVCGDIKMAVGVTDAIKSIIRSKAKLDLPLMEDKDAFSSMVREGRYHEDIYSVLI